jgi:hypothetical protein
MKAMEPPARPGALRRWGPLAAVLAALALVATLVLATDRPDDEVASGPSDGGPTTAAPGGGTADLPEGVVPFSVAEDQGIAGDIDWGDRCDTDAGQLAMPLTPPPECFAPFEGDNGGATATGVTGDKIRVVVFQSQANDPVLSFIYKQIGLTDTNEKSLATYEGFSQMFQQYYETYGREVEIVPYTASGALSDPVAATADAETIARDLQPFVVIGGPLLGRAFAETLAANQVMCIGCAPASMNSFYEENSPYIWGVIDKSLDQGALMLSQYIGNRLAGLKAEYGGADVKDRERRFGLVHLSLTQDDEAAVANLEERLAEYGVTLTDRASYTDPLSLAGQAREILTRMRDKGVTTILFVGDPLAPQTLTENATQQGYFPEWLLGAGLLTDSTLFGRTYDQQQWAHAFGPSNLIARMNPNVAGGGYVYQWFWGEPMPAKQGLLQAPPLQMLYGALQLAGPELTQQSFVEAVTTLRIVPGNVLSPQVSWGERDVWPWPDYNGFDDQTETWWDPDATGVDEIGQEGTGMLTYANGGRRYLPGEWPDEPATVFGDDPDPVTVYQDVPPGIDQPDYEPLPRPGPPPG